MWLVGFPVSVVTFCSICDGRGIRAHAVTRGYTRLHAASRCSASVRSSFVSST